MLVCVALAGGLTGEPSRESRVAICLPWLQCEIQVPRKPGLEVICSLTGQSKISDSKLCPTPTHFINY